MEAHNLLNAGCQAAGEDAVTTILLCCRMWSVCVPGYNLLQAPLSHFPVAVTVCA